MNADAIRRYLQPSPTLRWHPWAPLAVLLLTMLFSFYFGAQWGQSVAYRHFPAPAFSQAAQVALAYKQEESMPARKLVYDSYKIDEAVLSFVKSSARPAPGIGADLRDAGGHLRNAFEQMLLKRQPPMIVRRESIVDLAEFRLRELSGLSARWQATSTYCQETRNLRTGEENLVRQFLFDTAYAYTNLLHRPIRAEDLAPAVPGHICLDHAERTPHG